MNHNDTSSENVRKSPSSHGTKERVKFPSRKKETPEQRTSRERQERAQAAKAADIDFDVELRFLIHAESLRALKCAVNDQICGVINVKSHKITYLFVADPLGRAPEGVLSLKGHFNSCLCVLESWNARYLKLDHFTHDYYGGSGSACVKTRYLVRESVVGMLIGVRGLQVDTFSYRHDCNIQIPSTALPKSSERVVCVAGRIPDTVKVVRDMFLVIASRPNALTRHVVHYDPSNYDADVAKRAGGIYCSPVRAHSSSRRRRRSHRHRTRSRTANSSDYPTKVAASVSSEKISPRPTPLPNAWRDGANLISQIYQNRDDSVATLPASVVPDAAKGIFEKEVKKLQPLPIVEIITPQVPVRASSLPRAVTTTKAVTPPPVITIVSSKIGFQTVLRVISPPPTEAPKPVLQPQPSRIVPEPVVEPPRMTPQAMPQEYVQQYLSQPRASQNHQLQRQHQKHVTFRTNPAMTFLPRHLVPSPSGIFLQRFHHRPPAMSWQRFPPPQEKPQYVYHHEPYAHREQQFHHENGNGGSYYHNVQNVQPPHHGSHPGGQQYPQSVYLNPQNPRMFHPVSPFLHPPSHFFAGATVQLRPQAIHVRPSGPTYHGGRNTASALPPAVEPARNGNIMSNSRSRETLSQNPATVARLPLPMPSVAPSAQKHQCDQKPAEQTSPRTRANVAAPAKSASQESQFDAQQAFCVFTATSSRPQVILSENIWNRFSRHLYLIGLDNPTWTSITCRLGCGDSSNRSEEKPYCLQTLLANIREFIYDHEQLEKITATDNRIAALFENRYVDPSVKDIFWSFVGSAFKDIEGKYALHAAARWDQETKQIKKIYSKNFPRETKSERKTPAISKNSSVSYKGRPVSFRKGGPIFDAADADDLCLPRKRKSEKWEANRKERRRWKHSGDRVQVKATSGVCKKHRSSQGGKRLNRNFRSMATTSMASRESSNLEIVLKMRNPIEAAALSSKDVTKPLLSSSACHSRPRVRNTKRLVSIEQAANQLDDREPPACWEEVVSSDGYGEPEGISGFVAPSSKAIVQAAAGPVPKGHPGYPSGFGRVADSSVAQKNTCEPGTKTLKPVVAQPATKVADEKPNGAKTKPDKVKQSEKLSDKKSCGPVNGNGKSGTDSSKKTGKRGKK